MRNLNSRSNPSRAYLSWRGPTRGQRRYVFLQLHPKRERAVDDEICARDEASGADREKYHGVGHLVRCTPPSRRIERQRGLVEFGVFSLIMLQTPPSNRYCPEMPDRRDGAGARLGSHKISRSISESSFIAGKFLRCGISVEHDGL